MDLEARVKLYNLCADAEYMRKKLDKTFIHIKRMKISIILQMLLFFYLVATKCN